MIDNNSSERREPPLAERVASTEIHVNNLYEAISSLSKNTNHQINELSALVSEGFKQMRSNSKPDHNKNIGIAMVFLIVVGFVGNSYVRDINRVESSVITLQDARLQSISKNTEIAVRVQATERAIILLDTTLQREMRLLGDTTNAKLDSLDKRVSKELDARTKRFEILEQGRDEQGRQNATSNAAQAERLSALERRVFGKP